MPTALEEAIARFDGVATAPLIEARAAFRDRPGFLDDLASLSLDPRATIADGASWILKAEIDEGATLPPEATDRLARSLDQLASWQAQLHLCQMADALALDAAQAGLFTAWARPLADHPRPLLRAWALHVTIVLGLRIGTHRKTLDDALDAADADPAGSVRARARKLRKLVGRSA